MTHDLSIEEKARISFDRHNRDWVEELENMSAELRAQYEEKWATDPMYDRMSLAGFERRYRQIHALFDELKEGNHFQRINDVDIYDWIIDTMKDRNQTTKLFGRSNVTNLSSRPRVHYLVWALNGFYFRHLHYRCTSSERLEQIIQTGTDRDDRMTYVTRHFEKAFEYGSMPKLLLVYDAKGTKFIGGGEGYLHEFTEDPKSLLQGVMRIQLPEGTSPPENSGF
ncbi:hypothetical protein ACFL3V_03630 [Nanoarchaeota archaeon]